MKKSRRHRSKSSSHVKLDRRGPPGAQAQVIKMCEILGRVRDWAGGELQARAWYCSQPIPALGGLTLEALVDAGQARAVNDYLDCISLGGFA